MRSTARCLLALAALLALPAAARAEEVTGTVAVVHGDNLRAGKAERPGYALRTRGRTLRLAGAGAQPALRPGRRVTITGRRRGRSFVVRRARVRAGGVPLARAAAAGPKKVAVLLVTLGGQSTQPWTADEVRARYFTDADSVNGYYNEVSRGDLTLTGKERADGDVLGWYAISASQTTCNEDAIAAQARTAAADDGQDLSGYDNIVYLFPRASGCDWVGSAFLPGEDAWINGTLAVNVLAHELGHNYGLHHAGSLRCYTGGVNPTQFSDDCDFTEYGDPFDVMGNFGTRWFNNYHLGQRSWLNPGGTTTVTAAGDYAIGALEPFGTVPAAVRIQRAPNSYLYLEYRQPFGLFDDFAPADPVVNGVSIRLAPEYATITQSRLLDAVPATTSRIDAPLAVGETFRDPLTGITVRTLGVDAASATVHVEFGPAGDVQPPTAPASLQGTPLAPRTVSLTWGAASDDTGVTGYRVEREGSTLTTTSETSYLDVAAPPGAVSTYTVRATDAAGNLGPPATVQVVTAAEPLRAEGTGAGTSSPPVTAPLTGTTGTTGTPTTAGARVARLASTATVSAGVRRSGTVGALAAADGRTFRVASGGAATSGLVASFRGIPRGASDLVVTFRGAASRACVRSVLVRRASGAWAEISRGMQGRRTATVVRTLRGPVTPWLRGDTVAAQVRCHGARARSALVLSTDQLAVSYRG